MLPDTEGGAQGSYPLSRKRCARRARALQPHTAAEATRKHHASSKYTLNSCTHMAMHGAQARCGRSLATFLALQALIGQVLHAHRDS